MEGRYMASENKHKKAKNSGLCRLGVKKQRKLKNKTSLFLYIIRKEKSMQCSQCGYYIKPTDGYYAVRGNKAIGATSKKVDTQICLYCFSLLQKDYKERVFPGVRDFFAIAYLVFEEYQNRRGDTRKSCVYEFDLDEDTFSRMICNDSPF